MKRTIGEAMHRGVVTCNVFSSAEEIARVMLDNEVSAVVVTDERLDVCGLVTKTDLIRCYGKDIVSVAAEDIMTPDVLTVLPDTPVHEAVQVMLVHRIHQLLIVTSGGHRRPVGIFTSGDAVALMAGESGPRTQAQIRCSECIRRLLSVGDHGRSCETVEIAPGEPQV